MKPFVQSGIGSEAAPKHWRRLAFLKIHFHLTRGDAHSRGYIPAPFTDTSIGERLMSYCNGLRIARQSHLC